MWFGTPDGLCRYDGSSLISYKCNPENENEPVNNFARWKIQEDKNGNIWYCNETGIYKWDAHSQKIVLAFSFKKELYKNSQFCLIELDRYGNLWMLNVLFGIVSYNINAKQLKVFQFPVAIHTPSVQYVFSAVDNENNIWLHIVTGNDPFLKFNKETGIFSTQLVKDPPHAIFFNSKNKILSYEDRLVFQNGKSSSIIPKIINKKKINFFSLDGLADAHNRLWMTARGNGLFYYDQINNSFHEYHHDNSKLKSLPFDLTTCLFIDRSDNLWIGMDGGGVAKIDLKQPKFNLFPLSEGDYPVLQDYFTKCFYEDHKHRIWFGSHNNGFSIYNPATAELVNYKNNPANKKSLPGNSVASIYEDRNGNLWIGTNAGICVFNESASSFTAIPIHNLPTLHSRINLFIYKFVELQNGEFIAATGLGLVKVIKNNSGKFEGYYYGNKNFLKSITTDVTEMSDGSLYVTVPGVGLYHLQQKTNSFECIKIFFERIDLRSIRKDDINKDLLWIGSGKGMIQFNSRTEQFKIWNENNGLANSYVYGSLEDEKHNLWISTNGGLSYLNRATNHIDNYSYQDGLQSNEFNTQALYKSNSGTYYFGGIKGFNWFKSKKFINDSLKPQVAIIQIDIDNTPLAVDSALLSAPYIQFAYNKNNIDFKFAALDYTRPEANKIAYQLIGWDKLPFITYAKSVHYSNLPPGKYTLNVKACNAAGVWSNEEKINIIIESPFWKRTWFAVIITFILLCAVILITYKISQQKAKRKLQLLERQIAINAERNRISADMHDEIGSGITHIALLSELIQTQHKEEKEFKKDIKIIATSARKLVQTMSEIIWALNPQNDTLENFLAYTREQSQQYFEPLEIQFNIDFPEFIPDIKLSNAHRRNLYLVTREALNNAMKHAGATEIQLKLQITNTVYCFSVQDNGKGMNERIIKPAGNGLKNMKNRMKDIGGTIVWIEQDKGTTVEYCLLL